ncbi:lectin protein kinase family protein [Euphorbia peplus]|nr:lectin protein kinase family protein [Euphorbia peplus]
MFDFFFGWRKASKCKKLIRRVQFRLKLLKTKRESIAKQLREDVAQLIKVGYEDLAFKRAEHLCNDETVLALYESLEKCCEFIITHLSYIRRNKDCPNDINEAVSTLIFASARCGDLPELKRIRKLFRERYGQRFETTALELLPGNLVNLQVKEKLSIKSVPDEMKQKLLEQIAKDHSLQPEFLAIEFASEFHQQIARSYQDSPQDSHHDGMISTTISSSIIEIEQCSSDVVESPINCYKAVCAKESGRIPCSEWVAKDSSSESFPHLPDEMIVYLDDIVEVKHCPKKEGTFQDQRAFKFKSLRKNTKGDLKDDSCSGTDSSRKRAAKSSRRRTKRRTMSRENLSVNDIHCVIYYDNPNKKLVQKRRNQPDSGGGLERKIEQDFMAESDTEMEMYTFPTNRFRKKSCDFDEIVYEKSNIHRHISPSDSNLKTSSPLTKKAAKPPYLRAMTMPQERSKTSCLDNVQRSVSFPVESPNHVHPKLPDYDEIEAKFMALKKEHLQKKILSRTDEMMTVNIKTHLVLFFVLVFSTLISARIEPSSSLSASNLGQSWRSENGSFSLGFIPLDPQTSPPLFLAAIYYDGGVPIWAAGSSTPVDSAASLQFASSGSLRLINGSGDTVWTTNTDNLGVTSATLQENGNLVLTNNTSTVWSSFENPVDTIVPSQNFTAGKILRSGSYSFTLLPAGNISLTWNDSVDSVTYLTRGLNSSFSSENTSLFSPSLGLSNGVLSMFDPTLPSIGVIVVYGNDYGEPGEILRFLKLDNDGNLRMYSSQRGSGNKTETWAAVEDQCRVYGYCGELGVCSYVDSNPVCGCPSLNFDFVDPNDRRKGCRRTMEIADCPGNVTMLDLEHTLLLTYPPQSIFAAQNSETFFIPSSPCRSNCLGSDSCVASTVLSDGSGHCYLKNQGFLTAYQDASLPSTSHIKVCPPVFLNPSPSSNKSEAGSGWKVDGWVLIVGGIGVLVVVIGLEFALWMWCCRKGSRFSGLSAQYALLEYASGAPVHFWYKELRAATKGFKEKLGTGGFGSVYKGCLANGMVVAVKQLEGIEQGERQFRMEVATISSTHHLNLVRLIGYCSEGRHRLLVYEFMKNGSLDQFLFDSGKLLNWEQRFSIAVATAKAITYLHEECRDCIVHCDIKPENILLDENYNAKVSDFGLAKLINSKENRYKTLASIRGTRGYLAPEWIANLPITSKSDIYSYGMVLLELVSGMRNFTVSEETNMKKFSLWAYEEFSKGNIWGIVDRRLVDNEVQIEQVMRAIQVAFWCIQEHPSHRPKMGKVVQMLEGVAEIARAPALIAATGISTTETSTYLSSNLSNISHTLSAPSPSSMISSLQIAGVSASLSEGNLEKVSSALLISRN